MFIRNRIVAMVLFSCAALLLPSLASAAVHSVTQNQGVGSLFDLDPGASYTHLLDFPADGNAPTINGVTFGAAGAGAGVDAVTGNSYSLTMNNPSDFMSGSGDLVTDFIHNGGQPAGATETLVLGDLTPGQPYEARFYYRSFGPRPNNVVVDTGDGVTVLGTLDQATASGENYLAIQYTPQASQASFAFTQLQTNNSWHQYAVSNQAADRAVQTSQFISELFNTGVDGQGQVVADGSADLHYDFVSGPQAPSTAPDAQVQLNHPGWVANDAASKWIGVTAAGTNNVPGGTYVYETTFELPPDADLSSVQLSGQWWADNDAPGTMILLNGQDTGVPASAPFNLAAGTLFSIAHGSNGALFQKGTNTLAFAIVNAPGTGPNPHGLRVGELVGTFNTVPEPASAGLIALGLAAATLRSRRRLG